MLSNHTLIIRNGSSIVAVTPVDDLKVAKGLCNYARDIGLTADIYLNDSLASATTSVMAKKDQPTNSESEPECDVCNTCNSEGTENCTERCPWYLTAFG